LTTAPWGIKTIPQSTTTSGGFNPNSTFADSVSGDNAYVPMRVRLQKMDKEQLGALARRLESIGYKVPKSGRITEDFIKAAEAAEATAQNAAAETGVPFTPEYYLNWFKNEAAGEAESSGTQSYNPYAQMTIFDPTKAKSFVNEVVKSVLKRDATPEEIVEYTTKLKKAQEKAKSASVTKYKMINGIRTAVTTGGLDEEQFLTDIIVKKPEYKQLKENKVLETKAILEKTARANGLSLNAFDNVDNWVQRINQGESIDTFKQLIRSVAKNGLPDNAKKLIDEGIDLETIYAPYKNTMATVLEVNPNTISLDDPTLRGAIGPDKEMSIYDFQRSLRKDPRWQYTNNAREEVSDVALKVLRDFGFQG
jgi:hypothetical protein